MGIMPLKTLEATTKATFSNYQGVV